MSELSSKFSKDDIKTLIEATNDWESVGNQDFHILQLVKNVPMPAEDHDSFDYISQIKEHFAKREKEIIASQEIRQEKAVFLKAKLMMVRKELGISQLFDMAANTDTTLQDAPAPVPTKKTSIPSPRPLKSPALADLQKKLELAELFIKDLGVQQHYEKFLKDKAEENSAEKSE